MSNADRRPAKFASARSVARVLLGSMLMFDGTGHLAIARQEFQAQVPPWFPADPDKVVLGSGVVEIALGATIAAAPSRYLRLIGNGVALFFTAVFPGNIARTSTIATRSASTRTANVSSASSASRSWWPGRLVHPHRPP